MIYEINWRATFSKNYLWDQRGILTHTKIYDLLEFLHTSNDTKDFYLTFKEIGSVNNLINNAQFIQPNPNINSKNKCSKLGFEDSFLDNYRASIKKLDNDNLGQIEHYHILAFTYQIRNNIFHGYKTVGMMTIKEQRERLKDYTNLILTTLEQFFDMLSTDYGYFRADNYELTENININN